MGSIVDRSKEHLVNSDRGVIQFRRLMLKLATDLQDGVEPVSFLNPDVYNVRAATCVMPRSTSVWEGARNLVREF